MSQFQVVGAREDNADGGQTHRTPRIIDQPVRR
jgi:hypothetical protein